MEISYVGDVNVRLRKGDLDKILNGGLLSGHVFGFYSKRFIEVNVFCSDDKFYSSGGLAEGFDEGSFQGWVLEKPREQTQLAFPWGEEEFWKDYRTLDVRISRPALVKVLDSGEDYLCGMARGIASGHVIDRLNLFLIPNSIDL